MNASARLKLDPPQRVVNFAQILPLFSPASGSPAPLKLFGVHSQQLQRKPSSKIKVPHRQTFSVPTVSGSLSQTPNLARLKRLGTADLALPPGMPRYVNVATLKSMLKAAASDVLLKRKRGRWEVCANDLQVDLADAQVQFRLGSVLIYS